MTLSVQNHWGPFFGHQFVPYRCEPDLDIANRYWVYVYDCNYSNEPDRDTMRISIDFPEGTWAYRCDAWHDAPIIGGTVGCFLDLGTEYFTSHPIIPLPYAALVRDHLANKDERMGDLFVFSDPADTVVISGPQGEIGNYLDSLFNDVVQGMHIVPIDGDSASPIGYIVPEDEWSCEYRGIADSALDFNVFSGAAIYAYHGYAAAGGGTVRFDYSAVDSALTVIDPTGGRGDNQYFKMQVVGATAGQDLVVGCDSLLLLPSDSMRFALTGESGVRVDDFAGSKSYTLQLNVLSDTNYREFRCPNVTIASLSSHLILPVSNWAGDSVLILVDPGMTGQYTDTIVVVNNCCAIRGDVDGSGSGPDISDLVYLVAYMFSAGPKPACEQPVGSGYYPQCDIDGVGSGPDISDLVAIVAYMFGGCPACLVPCPR